MNAAAGWHTDPHDQHLTRYWNGTAWSDERRWNGAAWVAPTHTVSTAATSGTSPAISVPSRSSVPVTPLAVLGGVAIATIGVFLPWEQDTVGAQYFGSAVATVTSGPTKVPAVAVLLLVMLGGIAALAWPSIRRGLSKVRSVAISVTTALLWVMPLLKLDALDRAGSAGGTMEYHLGLGWYATVLGLAAVSVGCVAGFLGLGARREAAAA